MEKSFFNKKKLMVPIILVMILSVSFFSGCINPSSWEPCENGVKLTSPRSLLYQKFYFVYDTEPHDSWKDYKFKIEADKSINRFWAYVYDDLDVHTKYHYRAVMCDVNESRCSVFSDSTFCPGGPYAITVDANNVKRASATLHGELTLLESSDSCEVWFEYASTGHFIAPHKTNKITLTLPDSFSIDIGNLFAGHTYYYRVVASNDIYTHYGEIKHFTTLSWLRDGAQD